MDLDVGIPHKALCVFDQRRYTLLYGGRGSGKSHSIARALLLMAAQEPKRVLCCREIMRSIKDSVHRLLSDLIEEMHLENFYTVLETEIRGANGSLFIFSGLSTQTIESIKSMEGVDLVFVDEAQRITDTSWRLLIPTIRKPGSRFVMAMNPMLESDPTSQRFLVKPPPDCLAVRMNYSDNPWFPDELEAERLYHKETDPDTYDHVWEGCHLPAVSGAIYFHEMQRMQAEDRIRDVPYDPQLKVHTVWDLGIADNTSIILCQVVGNEVRVFDYLEDNNKPMSDYAAQLRNMNLNWGDDWIPHDGWHRQYTTGRSPAEMLQGMGRSPVRVPDITVMNGIKTAREVFPRVYIDKNRCGKLIECLKRYRWDIPANGNDAKRPLHDSASHGADSFRYMAVSSHLMTNNVWSNAELNYPELGYAA